MNCWLNSIDTTIYSLYIPCDVYIYTLNGSQRTLDAQGEDEQNEARQSGHPVTKTKIDRTGVSFVQQMGLTLVFLRV
jgi:hypothetical protein